jgi:hypothetical protein
MFDGRCLRVKCGFYSWGSVEALERTQDDYEFSLLISEALSSSNPGLKLGEDDAYVVRTRRPGAVNHVLLE